MACAVVRWWEAVSLMANEGKEPLKELGQCPVYFSLRCTERNILPLNGSTVSYHLLLLY